MGIRFQKRIKIAPGVRLNLSKGSPSVSVGGHGLTTNLSKRGVTTTASIRGSGVSYRRTWNLGDRPKRHVSHRGQLSRTIGMLVFAGFVALSGFCSRPSASKSQASPPWTPERMEKSGIFKDEPTATPSPPPHAAHKKRRHRAR